MTIALDDKAFRYYNVMTHAWELEGGEYKIRVGAGSGDIRLRQTVRVRGTDAPMPYDPARLPSYYAGRVTDVPDAEFAALLGYVPPPARWDRGRPLERNDSVAQLLYAHRWIGHLAGRVIVYLKECSERRGKPDLNILFIYSITFRGIAKMMGGAVDMKRTLKG